MPQQIQTHPVRLCGRAEEASQLVSHIRVDGRVGSDKASRHRGYRAASALPSLIRLISAVNFMRSGHGINHASTPDALLFSC